MGYLFCHSFRFKNGTVQSAAIQDSRNGAEAAMDKPVDAYEVDDRTAQLIAEETARLLRDLTEIEDRLELVERSIRRSLLD